MTASYALNTQVKVSVTFQRKTDNVFVDPDDVSFTYRISNGPKTVLLYSLTQITKDDVGKYSTILTVTTPGSWRYAWQGIGTIDAQSYDNAFIVEQSVTE